jgi:glutathione S-transferase
MIRLYHCVSARSFRALWALEELGLPYELVMLPFPPRQHAREFLDVNPLGTIPLFVHGQTRMTESAAICHYLCALVPGTPLELRPGDTGYGSYLDMLHFGEATLTFPQTLVLRYAHFEPEHRRMPTVADDYAKWFLARLRKFEPPLAQGEFVCADRFTVADISVGYALMLADYLDLAARFTPAVAAYWKRLRERPAFLRALEAQHAAATAQGVSTVPAPLGGGDEVHSAGSTRATHSPNPILR